MENIFENLPDLYTNRIRLRKINQNDLEQLFSFLSNDNVTRYMIIDKIIYQWKDNLIKNVMQ